MRLHIIFPFIAILFGISAAQGENLGEKPDGILDPSRIGWSAVQFKASKLFLSVKATVSIADANVAKIGEILIEPGEGTGTRPGEAIKELLVISDLLSRHMEMSLFLNTDSGAALQRISHDTGSRMRHRIYRFTDIGAYQRTWWPVGDAEERLPRDRWPEWSERAEGLNPYPEEAFDSIVTEPAALLYIIGAAELNEPGDEFKILAYIRRHVHRVHVEVLGLEDIRVKFDDHTGNSKTERKGPMQTIRLMVRGETIDDQERDFEMLGLRGDIIMHLDPTTRAPLQLTGAVKIMGRVTMKIQRLIRPDVGG